MPTHKQIAEIAEIAERAYGLFMTWGRIAEWNWATAERELWEIYYRQVLN